MHKDAIGRAAARVWKTLGSKKKVALSMLPKVLDEDVFLVQQAVGWLAREDKIQFEKQGRALYVKLSPTEACAYRDQDGR